MNLKLQFILHHKYYFNLKLINKSINHLNFSVIKLSNFNLLELSNYWKNLKF